MNRRTLLTTAFLACAAYRAAAQTTAPQTVRFRIDAINQIAFTGSPSLAISTATPGSNPTNDTDVATWAVTTNQSGAKITASINSNMPAGVTLSVNLAAPSGATSAGSRSLSTTAVDLVTGITMVAQGAMAVTYTLAATTAAGVLASTTRTVTYTITGGT
jgi:hypothetical protein